MTTDAPPSARHYRTILANERTYLAWQGMAAGLLVASIAVQCIPAAGRSSGWQVAALVLAVAAVVTAWTGLHRWRKLDRAIRHPAAA
ncbi:MAG: DUF202 domain-containing protein [Mycobacterium sp.]